MDGWQRIDHAPADEARARLQAACGSRRWVERMMQRRPFGSDEALVSTARQEWFALQERDWREAFLHHPKIGDRDALPQRFPDTAHLSAKEQQGVSGAAADILDALAAGNRLYEEKFGFVFIVCAAGKSAPEMLGLLRSRLANAPDREMQIAAGEQAKITERRLLAS